jgi:uncharacterized membrane protein
MEVFLKPLVLIPGLTGIIFTITALILFRFPPKKINWLYGYRTIKSMKSQDAWDFAQHYSSRLMLFSGLILLIIACCALLFPPYNETTEVILSLILVFAAAFGLVILTERELERRF